MTATTNANNHSMRKYCKRFRLCNENGEFLGDLTRQSSTGATRDDFAWTVSQSQMRPATPNPPSSHRLNISVEGLSRGRLRAQKVQYKERLVRGRLRAWKIAGKEGEDKEGEDKEGEGKEGFVQRWDRECQHEKKSKK